MGRKLKTHRPLRADIDDQRRLVIPSGEIIDETYKLDNGKVRIFWKGNTEGMGGLTVELADLEECASPI